MSRIVASEVFGWGNGQLRKSEDSAFNGYRKLDFVRIDYFDVFLSFLGLGIKIFV